jgi:putative endonuclease
MSKNYFLKLGKKGENIAQYYLQKHNYNIMAKNIKLGYYELDIVAQKGKTTVFVEVKTKLERSLASQDIVLTRKQIKNLKKGVARYCQQQYINFNNIRMDLIFLVYKKEKGVITIKHYQDIF